MDTGYPKKLMLPRTRYYTPLFPQTDPAEECDQGDPYCLTMPADARSRYAYYIYHTDKQPPADGLAFTCYATNDFVTFSHLGKVLKTNEDGFHWAPCVFYTRGVFVMIYSRSDPRARGKQRWAIRHMLHRAVADSPEGPFTPTGPIQLPPDIDFSFDADVYRKPDGELYLAFDRDFNDEPPYGSGIVEAAFSEDGSELLEPPRILARPSHESHLWLKGRRMPWKTLRGIDWKNGDAVDWYCMEAPVGGLVSPGGKLTYLYSGGNFKKGTYFIGALQQEADGTITDLVSQGHVVLKSVRESGITSIGHPSLVSQDMLICHGRFGARQPRQAFLAPLSWNEYDRPYCPTPQSGISQVRP